MKWLYRPLVGRRWPGRWLTALAAALIVAVSVPVALRLGGEFMPRLDEGDILIEAVRLPSAALEGALPIVDADRASPAQRSPRCKTVFCKTGRPEIANDVMGVHQTDVWVMLKP